MDSQNDKNLIPQFIPIKCPVCGGRTTVNWGKEICAACKGKGYIPVPPIEKEEPEGGQDDSR